MTPEEPYDVISDLKKFVEDIEKWPNDDTFRFEIDRAGAKAILAAIRAAENGALEGVYNSLMDQAAAHSNPDKASVLRYAAFFALFGCSEQEQIVWNRTLRQAEPK